MQSFPSWSILLNGFIINKVGFICHLVKITWYTCCYIPKDSKSFSSRTTKNPITKNFPLTSSNSWIATKLKVTFTKVGMVWSSPGRTFLLWFWISLVYKLFTSDNVEPVTMAATWIKNQANSHIVTLFTYYNYVNLKWEKKSIIRKDLDVRIIYNIPGHVISSPQICASLCFRLIYFCFYLSLYC